MAEDCGAWLDLPSGRAHCGLPFGHEGPHAGSDPKSVAVSISWGHGEWPTVTRKDSMAETHWYWRRKRNQTWGYWEDIEAQVRIGPIPLTEDGRAAFVPRVQAENYESELQDCKRRNRDLEAELAEVQQKLADEKTARDEAEIRLTNQAGKIEQELENEQVRRMRQMGHCPVCGGEDPNG